MAAFAPALVGTLGELPLMLVLMAIGTDGEGNVLFEIAAFVAIETAYFAVLADEGILGLGVIEPGCEGCTGPGSRVVAGFAGLLEFAFVWIGVAVSTILEFEVGVARLTIRPGRVALGAGDRCVLAGEGISGLGMVEGLFVELGALPACGVVALQAVLAEAPLVRILMAGAASCAETHPRVIQVLGF